jgi:hypothetical protein
MEKEYFIRFNEKAISDWETQDAVKRRDQKIEQGHRGWRNARGLDPDVGYPRNQIHHASYIRAPVDQGAGTGMWLQCGKYPGADLCRYR